MAKTKVDVCFHSIHVSSIALSTCFMASKRSTRNNTSIQNQPPSREVKSSLSNKPLEFPTFDPSRQ